MTQRYSAFTSPVSPSSPSTGIPGNAAARIFSISAWQRTSNSSLMSWASAQFTRLGLCQLACMTLPAARAAFTAVARADFNGIGFIKILRDDFAAFFQQHFLLAAFGVEHIVLRGFEHMQQVGGFEQARGRDEIGAGGVKRGHVRQQFGVDNDFAVRIQLAKLAENFEIVRALDRKST